jgi:Na+-driven multidrug efflux pump
MDEQRKVIMDKDLLLNNKIPVTDPARELFLNSPLGSLILKNALPAVASMLFMALYHVADAIMVGRSLGPEALASVNILYPILAFFIGLAAMIGVGGNARVAVLQGAGFTASARRVLGLVVTLGIILGLTGSLVTVLAFAPILKVLGTSGSLGSLAGQYLHTIYPFYTTMILIFILEQTVRNDGRPNLATGVMMAMALLNILLDYIFLFPLQMGINGAALATGLSQSLGALIFMGYFIRKKLRHRPGLRIGMPGGGLPALKMIAYNGSSEFLNSVAAGLTTFLFNRALLAYTGSAGVAAFAMVQYLIMFGSVIIFGISVGLQPILSYNHGAGNSKRVKDTLKISVVASTLVSAVLFVLIRWQAPLLISLFIPDHPQTALLTTGAAEIISWSLLIMPVGIIGSAFFTALEKAGQSLLIAISRGLLFTVVGLLVFPVYLGVTGIWITPLFSECVTVLITVYMFYRWIVSTERKAIKASCKALPVFKR